MSLYSYQHQKDKYSVISSAQSNMKNSFKDMNNNLLAQTPIFNDSMSVKTKSRSSTMHNINS